MQDVGIVTPWMEKYVSNIGPLSVSINSSCTAFENYKSGVILASTVAGHCTLPTDHVVTIVGMGTENGVDYWFAAVFSFLNSKSLFFNRLIRNSWGTSMGDNGYYKLERGKRVCMIEYHASYGLEILGTFFIIISIVIIA